ncbi:hypothetical protein ERX46_01390 [Brumimicrobium glaciale]|uniref:Outer membrane protein beta-barrel domain-containing protein n=1 Tax=Brumimicrobium glaciale TaxID=200475 RepID=A0A4Q4KR28_9FLAO|nr:hypothetical protein [Brumimicrobium glaciale]RYM35673.1 hypothetical protein ERX46_01390 [Brumimicrobium glaciale]
MKNLHLIIFACLLFCFSQSTYGQSTNFFNQKNIFSVRASFNPRLIPIGQNGNYTDDGMYANEGVGRGTYYQYYDQNNKLVGGDQKFNLMLNASYKRIYNSDKVIGVEFNYQKHNLTINETANIGFTEDDYDISKPFLISTPVFNTYDIQILLGSFSDAVLAPNQHLFTYGLGVRMFSLDQDQNYRIDSETPITDLDDFLDDYEKVFIYTRFSMNYTYRMLITKNLSLDLGLNFNIGLYQDMDAVDNLPMEYGYFTGESAAYSRNFVRNKLGHETFFNMLYFRTGLSFAI